MNTEELKAIIFKHLKKIAPETEPSELIPDENMREALNIDSFDALQFIVSLGEELDIEIPEKDYSKTATLKDLLSYLNAHEQKEQNISEN